MSFTHPADENSKGSTLHLCCSMLARTENFTGVGRSPSMCRVEVLFPFFSQNAVRNIRGRYISIIVVSTYVVISRFIRDDHMLHQLEVCKSSCITFSGRRRVAPPPTSSLHAYLYDFPFYSTFII